MTVVRKILETVLVAGSSSVTFTDALIPNSILKVTTTDNNVFPISQTVSGTSLQLTFNAQTGNIGVALEIIKQGLDIIDDLTSDDDSAALSAKQGKTLKQLIDAIPIGATSLDQLSDVTITEPTTGQFLIYTSNNIWENVTVPDAESEDF